MCRAGFLQLAPGSSWNSSKSSSIWQPFWAGGSSSQQWSDALFDAEIDEFLGLSSDPQQQQQQQQMPTAADWVLGEYADAAQGLHTFSTLDEDDLATNSGSSARQGSSSSSSSKPAAAVAAAGMPVELGARDLRQLIRQYSWNADKPELLQVRGMVMLVLEPSHFC
jgi:hypothetical protein